MTSRRVTRKKNFGETQQDEKGRKLRGISKGSRARDNMTQSRKVQPNKTTLKQSKIDSNSSLQDTQRNARQNTAANKDRKSYEQHIPRTQPPVSQSMILLSSVLSSPHASQTISTAHNDTQINKQATTNNEQTFFIIAFIIVASLRFTAATHSIMQEHKREHTPFEVVVIGDLSARAFVLQHFSSATN